MDAWMRGVNEQQMLAVLDALTPKKKRVRTKVNYTAAELRAILKERGYIIDEPVAS